MYSKEDLEKVNAQIRRERLQLYVPAGLLIVGGIVAFIFRMKVLTMVLLALGGILFIFSADVLIGPLKAYRRHLENALGSDQKEFTGVIKNNGYDPVHSPLVEDENGILRMDYEDMVSSKLMVIVWLQ